MGTKKFSKSFIITICLLILIVSMKIVSYNQKKEASEQYDLPANVVLSEYRDKSHCSTYITILEEKRCEVKVKSFCGNDDICHISAPEKVVLHISCKNKDGEGKLLFENKDGQIINTIKLEDGQTEVVLDADEYNVFLVGKWFNSKFELQSENIIFQV